VGRMGAAIIGMEAVALLVAVLSFGWPALLVGAPLLVGTLIVLVVVELWEYGRSRRERRRAARWAPAAQLPGGLMSGFFEVAAIADQPPMPAVELPGLRRAIDRALDRSRAGDRLRRLAAHRRLPLG
jgi:hypothetical protein